MFDLWGFLLQTLTASGVAALILIIKALFKDKLSPKWQFAIWGILGIIMLMPAGLFGRYVLFRWQIVVEIVKSWFGDFSFTKVLFPVPIISSVPKTVQDWLFAVYVLGVLYFVFKYAFSYFKLRRVLKLGSVPNSEKSMRIGAIASEHGLKIGKILEVSGLPSAFVCGVFRPILVMPADGETDVKIILHELFHLKNRDTLWSVIICALKCLHWCNPLVVYCANRALNDLESRCDQYVLEQLEGEERREYGHILLSMANDRFSKTPASTCINNGGKNIRERIENIARFKKYPQGMGLVSVCIIILLGFPLVMGAQSSGIYEFRNSVSLTLASARSVPCTTPAGAFDAYGKSVIDRNGYYRTMCAPESMQKEILSQMLERNNKEYPIYDSGLEEWVDEQGGYYVYNLRKVSEDAYEALFVVKLNYPPDGNDAEFGKMYLAAQHVRVENEKGRWVAIPLQDFSYIEALDQNLSWGCDAISGITYSGQSSDFRVEVSYQTVHTVESTVTNQADLWFLSSSYYDKTPKPNTEFTHAARSHSTKFIYMGTDAQKNSIVNIAFSLAPVYHGQSRPEVLHSPFESLSKPIGDEMSGGSNSGEQWGSKKLKTDWRPIINMNGGGGSADPTAVIENPEYFAIDLYINGQKVSNFDLILEGREFAE